MPDCSCCLQVLINNAGMLERCTLEDVSEAAMISSYRVNCMGPLFTVQALLKQKLLQPGALIANVTSLVCPSHLHRLQQPDGSNPPVVHVPAPWSQHTLLTTAIIEVWAAAMRAGPACCTGYACKAGTATQGRLH